MMATAMSQMGSLGAVNGSVKMNSDKPDSLYACTSCFSRYSLEALSPDSMLCKVNRKVKVKGSTCNGSPFPLCRNVAEMTPQLRQVPR